MNQQFHFWVYMWRKQKPIKKVYAPQCWQQCYLQLRRYGSNLGVHQHEWINSVLALSRVRLFVTPWTVVHQAPLSVEFSRQEYWSGLPVPSPIRTHTHTHTVEYYSAIKNEILPFAVTWMAVENIILSEMSDKNKYCVTTYLWNLKNTTN